MFLEALHSPVQAEPGLLPLAEGHIQARRRSVDHGVAVTLAELSAGPHQVRPNTEQDLYDEHEERARRTEAL